MNNNYKNIDIFDEEDWDEIEYDGSFFTWLKKNYHIQDNWKNITYIDCSCNNLENLKGIEKLVKLEKLYCNINQLKNLNGIENLTNLKLLWCNNNQLTNLNEIKNLNNLTSLNFSNNLLNKKSKHYNDLKKRINSIYGQHLFIKI
jgi:Leucine-rich repeat (LRR) protein